MKRIAVLGLGYIGLPTAVLAAECGYTVFGFDINEHKVKRLNTGDPTIIEPEIQPRLISALKNRNLQISSTLHYADCFVIAVPTPTHGHYQADVSFVMSAAELVAKRIMPGNLVILESTVPVGTTEMISQRISEISGLQPEVDFFTAYCPERVLPGKIFKELVENDRVVGGCSQKACDMARNFYARFVKGFVHITTDKSAEMVKLIENSSRDVQIAFANQVGAMCQAAGIDPYHVIELANRHPRVNILSPSCGVGGHCIAVDPWFLINAYPNQTKLMRMAREINDNKPVHVLAAIMEKVAVITQEKKSLPVVLSLGITFKPDVDDIRESPALKITQELARTKSLDLIVYDPCAHISDLESLNLPYVEDLNLAIHKADLIVVLVKHKRFLLLSPAIFETKYFIDTCGLTYDLAKNATKEKFKTANKSSSSYDMVTF